MGTGGVCSYSKYGQGDSPHACLGGGDGVLLGQLAQIARPTNSRLMPEQCRLSLVHPERPEHSLVQTPNTDVAYLSLGLPAWERRLGKNLLTKL